MNGKENAKENQLDRKLPRSHFTPLTLASRSFGLSLRDLSLSSHSRWAGHGRLELSSARVWNLESRVSSLKRTPGRETCTVHTAVIAACAKGVHARLRYVLTVIPALILLTRGHLAQVNAHWLPTLLWPN